MSSSYQKTIWIDGDIITAEKLNNIENGIKNIADQDSSDDSWIVGDGKTRFHISIPEIAPNNRRKFTLKIESTGGDDQANIDIDWGDGTIDSGVSPTGGVGAGTIYSHNYTAIGKYTITITVNLETIGFLSYPESNYNHFLIRRVEIGDNVTSIGEGAFFNCINLTNIIIPEGVTSIGMSAFMNCQNLTSIIIPNTITSISISAFSQCLNLTSIIISEGVTNIQREAFAGCPNLTNITIPNTITVINPAVFAGCSNLTNIIIPDTVTNIDASAFEGCFSLTSIIIPNGVTNIGAGAFSRCSSLISVTIPEGVTNIGAGQYTGSFADCTSMSEYHLRPTTPPSIAELTFNLMPSDCIIYVPEESVEAYKTTDWWADFADRIQAEPTV